MKRDSSALQRMSGTAYHKFAIYKDMKIKYNNINAKVLLMNKRGQNMLYKFYKKSEIWFAVTFIMLYVVSNSFCLQLSEEIGMEMICSIPVNLILIVILFVFVKKHDLMEYYGLGKVKCKAREILYYIPLVVIATVNLWLGIRFKMDPVSSIVYFAGMILTGIMEEMIFRGLLFKAMSRDNLKSAIIVTSLLFGIGHLVNLINGNSADLVATICQLFYAVAIGFLLVAVLYTGKSIIPCMITHSMLNALSTFSNEEVLDKVQIPVSIVLCIVSGVCAYLIFRKTDLLKMKTSKQN